MFKLPGEFLAENVDCTEVADVNNWLMLDEFLAEDVDCIEVAGLKNWLRADGTDADGVMQRVMGRGTGDARPGTTIKPAPACTSRKDFSSPFIESFFVPPIAESFLTATFRMAFTNDGSFMEQYLAKMKEKEQAGGAAGAGAAEKASEAGPSLTPQAEEASGDFSPSASFTGERPGFIFKLDHRGLGYYRDVVMEERKAAELAKTKPPTVIKPRSFIAMPAKGGIAKKKNKKDEKETEEGKSKYLSEMQKYKDMSCGSDTKHDRPLVK
eukprot:gene18553-25060_t